VFRSRYEVHLRQGQLVLYLAPASSQSAVWQHTMTFEVMSMFKRVHVNFLEVHLSCRSRSCWCLDVRAVSRMILTVQTIAPPPVCPQAGSLGDLTATSCRLVVTSLHAWRYLHAVLASDDSNRCACAAVVATILHCIHLESSRCVAVTRNELKSHYKWQEAVTARLRPMTPTTARLRGLN
jgi:hypothetical protein